MNIRNWLLGCGIVALAGGCATATAPSADARCPAPGGEFASNGCAVVSGVVRDAKGQGMPAATVTINGSSECGGCFGITTVADKSGSFRIVVWRFDLLPGAPLRDSVSATVRLDPSAGTRLSVASTISSGGTGKHPGNVGCNIAAASTFW